MKVALIGTGAMGCIFGAALARGGAELVCLDRSADVVAALQQHVRSQLAAHEYPREIEFLDELPKTPSGKIQRFLLRAREII